MYESVSAWILWNIARKSCVKFPHLHRATFSIIIQYTINNMLHDVWSTECLTGFTPDCICVYGLHDEKMCSSILLIPYRILWWLGLKSGKNKLGLGQRSDINPPTKGWCPVDHIHRHGNSINNLHLIDFCWRGMIDEFWWLENWPACLWLE